MLLFALYVLESAPSSGTYCRALLPALFNIVERSIIFRLPLSIDRCSFFGRNLDPPRPLQAVRAAVASIDGRGNYFDSDPELFAALYEVRVCRKY